VSAEAATGAPVMEQNVSFLWVKMPKLVLKGSTLLLFSLTENFEV
jgi:hypothetical protein